MQQGGDPNLVYSADNPILIAKSNVMESGPNSETEPTFEFREMTPGTALYRYL